MERNGRPLGSDKLQLIWETYNGKKKPASYHIHHIDGDKYNNHPENLQCISPEEHWQIHKNQWDEHKNINDARACNLLLKFNPDKSRISHPAWNKGLTNMHYKKGRQSSPRSEETKEKIRQTMTGKKYSEKRKQAMRDGYRYHTTNAVPVTIQGIDFPTKSAAARHFGHSISWVTNKMNNGGA